MRESGSKHGPEAADAAILALLKDVFKPGTLSADEDWYKGKPEFSYGSVAADTKAERYRRANMAEFKEITKDKEISFKGFQKLCRKFPDFSSLFDFGVREFGMQAEEPEAASGLPTSPTGNFDKMPSFMATHHKWPTDGKKQGTVPCMYCEADLPHTKRSSSCVVAKETTALGNDLL